MGEFGTAILYVRPDRLPELRRVQVGWRQIVGYKSHFPPLDSPDPVASDYQLGKTTAQLFEVSTPNWPGLAAAAGSLGYIRDVGGARIVEHRAPLLQRLQDTLPKHGFAPLTPPDSHGAYLVYALKHAGCCSRLGAKSFERRIGIGAPIRQLTESLSGTVQRWRADRKYALYRRSGWPRCEDRQAA